MRCSRHVGKRRRLIQMLCFLVVVPFFLLLYSQYGILIAYLRMVNIDEGIIKTEVYKLNQSLVLRTDQVCVHPLLDINHPSMVNFFGQVPPLVCGQEPNWVYTDNGTFRISKQSQERHGAISCKYTPFRFSDDYITVEDQYIEPMHDRSPLQNDFFTVSCNAADGETYFNLHSGIAYNAEAHKRAKECLLPPNAMGVSVLMLGLDSVSRMTMKRKMPKTVSYFTSVLKGLELEGYNIVGDGTPAALLPILTGLGEDDVDLPEGRRGFPGAKPVDDYPWIMKKFENIGYVTQWAEDESHIGTFTFRRLGFSKPPVDHYMRPFYVKAFKYYWKFKHMCFGSTRRYFYHLKWFKDACLMYGDRRKFMFSFHAEYSHTRVNFIQYADDDTLEFLRFLQENGHLNNTIVILMSDHGARFDYMRKSMQGKLEERLPYFGFSFPPWFQKKYPLAMENFRTNVKRLSVPFDIYATFMDILDYRNVQKGNISERGISLFREIPKERRCADAGVSPHWCACLSWTKIDKNDPIGLSAVERTIQAINSATEVHRNKCKKLVLAHVRTIEKYSNTQDLLKFKQTFGYTGVADLSDKMAATEILYMVTFQTAPGFGLFEATVKHDTEKNSFTVDVDNGISRTNKYGDAPSCIMFQYPHLRPYCYCKRVRRT